MQVDTRGAPIGIFDSGIGGLSVWREIVRQLPDEGTLYVADQGHVPYGPRPLDEIRRFSSGITEFLLSQNAKLIVVACNTASGAALHALRAAFPETPFVGMEPAVKPAAEHTTSGIVGVLATPTTFEGDLFRQLVHRFGRGVDIRTQVCPGLVESVEAGTHSSPTTVALLQICLAPLVAAGIDQLVLGCTHYPFLRAEIERILGPGIAVIDPAPAVARQVGKVLQERALQNPGRARAQHTFYTSGAGPRLADAAGELVGYRGTIRHLAWIDGALQPS